MDASGRNIDGLESVISTVVELYDEEVRLGSAVIDDGQWSFSAVGLGYGVRTITARVNDLNSQEWRVEISAPLEVDKTEMKLSGVMVLMDLPLSGNDPSGTTQTRQPTGGLPPYVYSSSDTTIASVDQNGLVKSVGNGTAVIAISDARGEAVSFVVVVSNVYRYVEVEGEFTHSEAMDFIVSDGAEVTPRNRIDSYRNAMVTKYGNSFPKKTSWCGYSDNSSNPYGYMVSGNKLHATSDASWRIGVLYFVLT